MDQVMSMSKAIPVIEALLNERVPTMLWGDPGTGKTQVVHQLAKKKGIGLIDWRTNLRDPVDARGLPVPDLKKRTTEWLRPSELPIIGSDCPDRGYFLMDEINTGSPAMLNVCLQIALEHRVGEHEFKPGWTCVATGNRAKDKAVVGRMSSALKNRFAHVTIEPDIKAWSEYALTCPEVLANPTAAYLVAFLRFRPQFLHRMPVDDTVNAYPTPRQWFQVMKFLDHPKSVRPHIIGTLVGEDIAAELEGFLRVAKSLPTLDEVVANPAGAKLPLDPAAQYAVVGMLSRGAELKTFGKIMEYGKRLGREFEVLLGKDAVQINPKLVNTGAYSGWAVANQEVLV